MNPTVESKLKRIPPGPGVYLYKDAAGQTIYVGKARALRDRVRNYLGAYGVDPKTDALLNDVARIEVILTDSVVEALALENNLIKQRSPRYNILLRDDKNYPYLQLTTNEAFPRVLVARRVERDPRGEALAEHAEPDDQIGDDQIGLALADPRTDAPRQEFGVPLDIRDQREKLFRRIGQHPLLGMGRHRAPG